MRKFHIYALSVAGILVAGCVAPQGAGSSDEHLAQLDPLGGNNYSAGSIGKLKLTMARDVADPSSGLDKPEGESYSSLASAKVTISSAEVHSIGGKSFKYAFEPMEVDLTQLAADMGSIMLRAKIPAGEYDQIRLLITGPGKAHFEDDSDEDLDIPSGEESGLKIFCSPALRIEPSWLTEAEMKIDVERSFVFTGADKVNFKPVLRATCNQPAPIPEPTVSPTPSPDPSVSPDPTVTANPSPSPDPSVSPSPSPTPSDGFIYWVGV